MPKRNKKNVRDRKKHVIKERKEDKNLKNKKSQIEKKGKAKSLKKEVKGEVTTSEQDNVQKETVYFTQKELEEFKNILLARKSLIEELLKNREMDLTHSGVKEDTGNLSGIPQHLAEVGSQEYDKNFSVIILESVQKELKEIISALQRIDENKYGICENCKKPINKERLKVLPHTNLCLDCKILEENSTINH